MKIFKDFAFDLICVYILCLSIFAVSRFEIDSSTIKVSSLNSNKVLDSSYLTFDDDNELIKADEKEQVDEIPEVDANSKKVEVKKETKKEEPKKEEPTQPVSAYQYVQTVDTSSMQGDYITTGTITHYGHDCCSSGKTATGYDISDGRIYYTDTTFGSVRIVAAGKGDFKYGTILRLTGYGSEPIIAIVLDCGGIGINKNYKLDLLVESEAVANKLGVKKNVSIEVLRYGY